MVLRARGHGGGMLVARARARVLRALWPQVKEQASKLVSPEEALKALLGPEMHVLGEGPGPLSAQVRGWPYKACTQCVCI